MLKQTGQTCPNHRQNVLVDDLYCTVVLVPRQSLVDNAPLHDARGLVAVLLTVDAPADGAQDVQVRTVLLLLSQRVVEAVEV